MKVKWENPAIESYYKQVKLIEDTRTKLNTIPYEQPLSTHLNLAYDQALHRLAIEYVMYRDQIN